MSITRPIKLPAVNSCWRLFWVMAVLLFSSLALAACARVDAKTHHKRTEKDSAFRLTKEGQAASVIVIGKDATSAERHAAEELARYVKAISGADLQI